METQITTKKHILLLALGMAGCLLLAASDWLMIYGDPSYQGALAWLTTGAAAIPPARNAVAMAISFPAVLLYCFGLFAVRYFLSGQRRKTYCALTVAGLTPWLCLHLFYVMILFLFAWLQGQGQQAMAYAACEALFSQFQWIIPLAEVIMILPYVYLFVLAVRGRTSLPRWTAINNPLVLYLILSLGKLIFPSTAWKLAYTNGLMSEAMLLWFLFYLILVARKKKA